MQRFGWLTLLFFVLSLTVVHGASALEIHGRVRVNRVALAGATVTITGVGTRVTDEQGAYRFADLPPAAHEISVTHPGYSFSPSRKTIQAYDSSRIYFSDFTATPEQELSGKILFNGTGVDNVTVRLVPDRGAAVTNSAGEFRFKNVGSGTYTIIPEPVGMTTVPAQATVAVGTASDSSTVFSASGTLSISGIVSVDRVGQPGASVTCGRGASPILTGAAGEFTCSNLIPGTYDVTASYLDIVFRPRSRRVSLKTAPVTSATFQGIRRSNTLTGTVKLANGTPVPNVSIRVGNAGYAKTDAQGRYVFPKLANAEYSVVPFTQDYRVSPTRVEVSLLNKDGVQDFIASPHFALLSGRVVREDGSPLANIPIRVGGASKTVVTDAEGKYSVTVGRSYYYSLTPRADGLLFTPPNHLLKISDDGAVRDFTARVVTTSIHTISGKVTSGTSPLASVEIRIDGIGTVA